MSPRKRRYIPSLLSLLRILLTPLFIFLFICGGIYAYGALAIFTIAAFTDYLDGYFARRFNAVSSYGTFLDPFADKVFILGSFTLFWWYGLFASWMLAVVIIREFLTTLLRLFALAGKGQVVTAWHGKWKTTFQIVLLYYFQLYVVASPSEPLWGTILTLLTYGVVAFTTFSGLLYIFASFYAPKQ